jgi:ankyrin repeat protein
MENDDLLFRDAVQGLHRGDFSRLEPLFASGQIVRWHAAGRLADEPKAVAEALTCACFLGRTHVAEYLLNHGVDPTAGAGTGLDALHWAANRGQLESVRMLLRRRAPLETRSRYGGTVLGTAIWSAFHEPRPDHLQIIQELLNAGARVSEVEYPTGNEQIDALLRKHGAQ